MNRFEDVLAAGPPILLDGGFATQLEAQGHDIGTILWSAALLRDNPQAIIDAHRAYLDAGAQCIISASYQASRTGFAAIGITASQADELIFRSVELAFQARDEFMAANPDTADQPLVAASIGPYGAALHDGSEYSGHYGVSAETLRAFHAQRLSVLDVSGADVLACETIPDRAEAAVLADLLRSVRTPAWVSFSCRDSDSISDGTPLREVAALFAEHPRVLALGVNCTAPELITALIGEIRAASPTKAVVVYPNSGETYTAETNDWHGSASTQNLCRATLEWRAAGAHLLGGCCRTTPADIKKMGQALASDA